MTCLLELSNISKSFAHVRVLERVDFDVRAGEVHALMGENGAGKSTLIKIVAGVIAPSGGEMRIDGEAVRFSSPKEANARGIATVYQEMLLFPDLTVAENIFLGHAPRGPVGAIDWSAMRSKARALLDSLDSHDLDVDTVVGTLSVANRQRVEIAKALSQDARIVIMDEPTAALAETDAKRLLDIVRRLRDRGVGIIYVSHRMAEIFAIADRITVLRDGMMIGTRNRGDVDQPTLVSMMVGRDIAQLYPKVDVEPGEVLLEARDVCCGDRVSHANLHVRAGEIVGVAGLIGAGRTELALTLFGITPATSGEIRIDGKPVTIASPREARDLGIAYIPEDRGRQGLVKAETIAQNIVHPILDRISRWFFVNLRSERSLAAQSIKQLSIRTWGGEQIAGQLSGGNQQKVVVAKWLGTKPRILIMDEPTRGIDVGAKAEIYALMGKLAQEGIGILMISSELPEVLGMSDRIMVMNEGKLVAEIPRAVATLESVGAAMTNVDRHQETER